MIEVAAIVIDDLELRLFIGIYDHEKRAEQRLLASTRIEIDPELMTPERFYDYDPYVEFLSRLNGDHVETLEEVAQRIEAYFAQDTRVRRVALSLRKPDVFKAAAGVGVDVVYAFRRDK